MTTEREREREGKKKEWKASPRLYPLVFFASIKTGSTDADGRGRTRTEGEEEATVVSLAEIL